MFEDVAETVLAGTAPGETPREPASEGGFEPASQAVAEPTVFGLPIRAPYAEVTVGPDRVALLKDGGQVFSVMLQAIASAQSTICLEMYTIEPDATGRRFLVALADRARAGVEVNLLYDAFGSSNLAQQLIGELRDAGIRTLAYNPLEMPRLTRLGLAIERFFKRDHRKILVVDSQIGFTGGQNLADPYADREDGGQGWRDTSIRIDGPAARELQESFLRLWQLHGGAAIERKRYRPFQGDGSRKIWFVSSLRLWRDRSILKMYITAFRKAKKRIWLTNAYFLPMPRLLRELRRAVRRGVDVKLIHSGTTNVRSVLWAAWGLYGSLLKHKVCVIEWRGEAALHAKTAVIDGYWSTVGTSNLDAQSLKRSLEINAVIEDEAFAAEMERMFQEDLADCTEICYADYKRWPLWKRMLAWLFFKFRDRL